MLKNKAIIDRLSLDQKLSLLARGYFADQTHLDESGMSNPALGADFDASQGAAPINYLAQSVPMLKVVHIEQLNREGEDNIFPSFNSLAYSWNASLVNEVANYLASQEACQGVDMLITPHIGVKTSIYGSGMTEDAHLSAKLGQAYTAGFEARGIAPIISTCALNEKDVEYLDRIVNKRVISDHIVQPFVSSVPSQLPAAIMTKNKRLNKNYRFVNSGLIVDFLDQRLGEPALVSGDTSLESAVDALKAGCIFLLDGNISQLKAAYENFYKLQADYEVGRITRRDFDVEIDRGRAIDEDTINACVDDFLTFAFKCKGIDPNKLTDQQATQALQGKKRIKKTKQQKKEEKRLAKEQKRIDKENKKLDKKNKKLAKDIRPAKKNKNSSGDNAAQAYNQNESASQLVRQATEQSIVLLKNKDRVLPIKQGSKVLVVGQLAETPRDDSLSFVDTIKQHESLPFEYKGHTYGYDINEERSDILVEEATYPASSADVVLVLLDYRDANGAPVVKLPPSQEALINELRGRAKKIVAVIEDDRSVDTFFDFNVDGLIVLPPSGKNRYEALIKVLSGEVNPSGKLAQTFYQSPTSTFLELKKRKDLGKARIGAFFGYRGYDSVGMSAKYPFGFGLSYTIFHYSKIKAKDTTIRFRLKNVGNRSGYETVQVYVGKKDSQLARPQKELKAFRKVYLRSGEAQIISININYDDLAVYDFMDDTRKVEDGKYEVYIGSSVSNIRLVTDIKVKGRLFDSERAALSGYLQSLSNILDGEFTLSEKSVRSSKGKKGKRGKKGKKELVRQNEYVLSSSPSLQDLFMIEFEKIDAPDLPEPLIDESKYEEDNYFDIEKLVNEPKASKASIDTAASPVTLIKDEVYEAAEQLDKFIDKSFGIKDAALDLVRFMAEGGISIDFPTCRQILSAMSASKLIFIKEIDPSTTNNFLQLLSLYFGSQQYLEEIMEGELVGEDRPFFVTTEFGAINPSRLKACCNDAAISRHIIHIAGLRDASGMLNADMIEPISSYGAGFFRDYTFTAKTSALSVAIPSNVWFFVMLKEIQLSEMPLSVMQNAVVLTPRLTRLAPRNIQAEGEIAYIDPSVSKHLNYHQFHSISNDCEKNFLVDEELWRRIDGVMALVNTVSPLEISNKEWRRLEKYTSLYLALDGTMPESVGSVFVSKVLPSIKCVVKLGVSAQNDEIFSEFDRILGDECIMGS